jgi:sugar lactone lactonase YvrE
MMKSMKHATLLKRLIIAITCGASLLAHTAFASVIPAYERLEPIKNNLSYPTAIALDTFENMYVTESIENKLRIFSQSGAYIKTLSGLSEPLGVAVDQQGRIFVGNKLSRNVEVYDSDLHFIFKLGSGDGEFSQPTAIAVYEDRIYVADSLEDVIKVYNPDGSFNFSFGHTGSEAGQFNFPISLAVNEISGELIVLDRQNIESWTGTGQGARVQIFDMDGLFKRSFGERGIGDGKLSKPAGVTVDSEGRIYVTDTYQQLVQVFDENGTFLTSLYNVDYQLRTPIGIIRGDSNRLFIASLHTGSVEVYGIDSYTQLSVEPLFIYFEGDEKGDNPALQSVEIGNEGNSPLNWSAYSEHSWITLSQDNGSLASSEYHTLEIGVNMAGLTEGIHTDTVHISAASGATEIVEVVISVVRPPTPELSVHPLSLEFVSVNGSTPASRSLSIANAGTGILIWNVSSNVDWISLDKATGTAPDDITVSVNMSGLKEGTFTGSLTITGEAAVSSPLSIPVRLDVREERGTISVTTNIDSATFIISGSESYSGSGTTWEVNNAPAGTYYIQFNAVQGYVTPSYKTQSLDANGAITFNGEYIRKVEEVEESADQGYLHFITGAGPGEENTGFVKIFGPDGTESGAAFQAHENTYGVNVAAGDINNDGIDEIITAPGPGPDNPAEISIFYQTGRQFPHLTTTVFPYLYGANIASGDINGDGYDEIIVGTGTYGGNPSELRVYVHDPEQGKLVDSGINLIAYESIGGVLVAAGDVDGDQHDEIITSSTPVNGNKIKIRIWSVDTSAGTGQWRVHLAKEFSMKTRNIYSKFSKRNRNIHSISITSADINGDGLAEIVTGSRSISGRTSIVHIFDAEGAEISEFQVGDSSHYITSVASADMDGDGAAEIIAGTVNVTLQRTEVMVFDAFGTENMTFTESNTQHGVKLAVGSLFMDE